MTTEPIPEAAMEAALSALYPNTPGEFARNVWEATIRTSLEAAAPPLRRQGAVQALREAADGLEFGQPISRWLHERADEMEAGK